MFTKSQYEKTRDENENLKMFQIEQCKVNSNSKIENCFHEEEENENFGSWFNYWDFFI